MQTKRVECPNCHKVLEVKNSKNEAVKHITCPVCAAPLQVKFSPQQEPLVAHTVLVPPPSNAASDGATQLGGSPSAATVLGGSPSAATVLGAPQQAVSKSLKLEHNGNEYPLVEGQNIIGRQASTSKASIQLPTSDRYMSRQHCSILVSTLPDGSKKAVLTNYQNKNATLVNGSSIQDGDQIRLQDGDQVTMGHTTVTFKMS